MSNTADIKAIVVTDAGNNFCSGGDVHEIIGPPTKLDMPGTASH
jgi:enoyl-CoA hydratase/carnithine racemase